MNIDKALQSAYQYCQAGNLNQARNIYKKILRIKPNSIDALRFLGMICCQLEDYDDAIRYIRKEIELTPSNADVQYNLGLILHSKGELDQAITCFQRAIELNPDITEAYFNLSVILQNKGHLDEAMTFYQRVLQLNFNNAPAHLNISHILLLTGDFKEGWKEYEWRWKTKDYCLPNLHQPLWNGSDITGHTILLYSEQGIGDAIQFIRYVPLIAQQGARVIVQCREELKLLLLNVEGVNKVIAYGEQLLDFDTHCPLLSLPLVFNTALETIPAKIPYITADPALIQKWGDKIELDNSKFKIGLSWAGSPTHKNDRNRSFLLDTFTPLAQFDTVIFYSLQKGKGSEQAKNPPVDMRLVDYIDEIQDFSDTAALIENLDLVISVDTAVAHLAGAMGKPVWTLLPFVPDWRWMLNREDSPWYPTMRLFRQPSPGDWESVIHNVVKELRIVIRNENR